MRHLKIVYVKADELATAKSHESAISQCNYLQQTDAQKKSRNSFWSQTIINTWHVRILWELYWESYTKIEKVISKLRKLHRNCECYIKIETAQKQLVLQSKKIKFLAHLPNQSLLRWIKREMKVLTWFGRACVAQWAPICPNGPGVPHEASTGSPTHYNVQIRESPAKWPLHCTSLYFNAQTRVSCDISFSKTDGDALCENI